MDLAWLTTTWASAAVALLTALGTYLAVVACTRIVGLRSFSKMSSFDFAITVAIGSMLATTILSQSTSLLFGAVALAALYGIQALVTHLRTRSTAFQSLLDNRPVLLMREGRFREAEMRRVGVTRADLLAKLREANVLQPDHALAVVFESTGDISVLHGAGEPEAEVHPVLLEGVDGA